jgi:hypothetical protein
MSSSSGPDPVSTSGPSTSPRDSRSRLSTVVENSSTPQGTSSGTPGQHSGEWSVAAGGGRSGEERSSVEPEEEDEEVVVYEGQSGGKTSVSSPVDENAAVPGDAP